VEYPVFSSAKQSIFDARRLARNRALLCPGAGFAALGYWKTGLLTYCVVVAAWATAIATAIEPSPARFWFAVGLFALSILLWFFELLTAHGDSVEEAPQQTPSKLWGWFGAMVIAAAAFALVAYVSVNYAVFTVGPEMVPTFRTGKRFLVRRTVDPRTLTRGKLILFGLSERNQRAEPGRRMIGRILAVPGDKLSLRNGRYYVNGVAARRAAKHSEHFITVVVAEYPEFTTVPADCFFVTQDSPSDGSDSAVLYWAERERLVSTSLLNLSRDALLEPIDETQKFGAGSPVSIPVPETP
jgi:signal peptidase I